MKIKFKSKSSIKKRFIIKNNSIKYKRSNLRHNLTIKSKKYKRILRKKIFFKNNTFHYNLIKKQILF